MAFAAAAIATAVGAIVSAYAMYQQGQAAAAAQDYQAKIARNQAIAARQAAEVAAENARERHQRVLAAQRARLGAAGVMSTEGSPLIVQMESAEQAALEEARIRYAGQVQAGGYESQAILSGYQARSARAAGYLGAGASLLTGLGAAYGQYARRGPTTQTPSTTDYGTVNY